MDPASTYKLVGVIGYLGILMAIGIVASRRMKDIKDYFAAGKSLGFLSVAFSARATGESAWLLLGLTGMGAVMGVKAFWVVVGETIGVTVAWLLMSRRFKRLTDRYDSITIPDYLESRFHDSTQQIRKVAAFALTVFVTIYVSAQIDATGQAFENFLGWNYYLGATIGFAVVLVYITTGGFLAVAWSDVFQGALMVLGLAVLPIVGIASAGGWSEVTDGLQAINPNLLAIDGGKGWDLKNVFGILSLALIGLGFMGSPQIFVRFLALKSEDEINKGAAVAVIWTLIADSGAVLVGMVGRYLLGGADLGTDGQDVLPLLVEHLMPAMLIGLYIAIVLSAIMSTVDSLLVLAGSAAARDFYQKVRHPDLSDDALVSISRMATFGLALIAFVIAMAVALSTESRSIFWFVIFGWSGIAATFCPAMILSLFWTRFTRRGVISAMVAGFIAVPFFKFIGPDLPVIGGYLEALEELPPAFATSFILGAIASLFDKDGQRRLEAAADELRAVSR
jgi:sodium/proline symporter